MTAESVIEALETLHSPTRGDFDYGYPRCGGCDVDGWEAEEPHWPCRTAAILWPDPDERVAIRADWQEWADARSAEVLANRHNHFIIAEAWRDQLNASLAATSIYLRPGENQ